MPNQVIGSSPEITSEINRALEILKKDGYEAKVVGDPASSNEVSVVFTFGESEQILKFKKDELRKPGTVTQRIVDKLNI